MTERHQERRSQLNKVRILQIDLDSSWFKTKTGFLLAIENTRKRMRKFGDLMEDKPTGKGWHLKCYMRKQVKFWRSIDIREYCGDDYIRMFFDIQRYRHGGAASIDILFDLKQKQEIVTHMRSFIK